MQCHLASPPVVRKSKRKPQWLVEQEPVLNALDPGRLKRVILMFWAKNTFFDVSKTECFISAWFDLQLSLPVLHVVLFRGLAPSLGYISCDALQSCFWLTP